LKGLAPAVFGTHLAVVNFVAHVLLARPGFYDAGVGRFLISPGFGGAATLLGGVLAFAASLIKLKRDREVTRQEREATRQERWWASLTWVYDRATMAAGRLPGEVALTMLSHLFDQAGTALEVATVDGILALFQDAREAPQSDRRQTEGIARDPEDSQTADEPKLSTIRAWAVSKGLVVNERGRVRGPMGILDV
jgi:hypothetical protein